MRQIEKDYKNSILHKDEFIVTQRIITRQFLLLNVDKDIKLARNVGVKIT